MAESGMNTMTMAHIGVEVAVAGAMAFWFNKKISELDDKVTVLTDRLAKAEEIIGQQNNMLVNYGAAFQQLMPQGLQRSSVRQQAPVNQRQRRPPPAEEEFSEEMDELISAEMAECDTTSESCPTKKKLR